MPTFEFMCGIYIIVQGSGGTIQTFGTFLEKGQYRFLLYVARELIILAVGIVLVYRYY